MAVTWKKLAYEDDVITKAFFAAKGDVIGASANDTPLILSVGTDGQVLTAASGEASGLNWTDALMDTDFAAKGDLLSASANDTLEVLSVGTNGQVLTADSGEASGLKWAAGGTPDAHAASHKDAGSDELLLHELGEPTGAVDFSEQQLQDAVVHTVADSTARDALTAAVGKIAWQTDELAIYACTVAV